MRIVVTGASGNVGTNVLQALAEDPAVSEIVGIARRLPAAHFQKTTWREADITRDELGPLFDGAEVVIHLAWLIQPSRDETRTREVNVRGSERVFQAVAAAQVPALIYASSVGAYAPGPLTHAVDESWPTTGIPSSFYSRHKAEVERLLDSFQVKYPQIRAVRLRPALTFKGQAATGIRRLFIWPTAPEPARAPRGAASAPLPARVAHTGCSLSRCRHAYRLAATKPISGAFNIAAEPVLDAALIAHVLGARPLRLPSVIVRRAVWASWKLRLQSTSPGWLDMGMLSPIMNTARARDQLGWEPRFSATQTVEELLDGLRHESDMATPPLDRKQSGRLRVREFATGLGGSEQ